MGLYFASNADQSAFSDKLTEVQALLTLDPIQMEALLQNALEEMNREAMDELA